MTTMSTAPELRGLPWGRPLTYDDLELMPDDGHRYELIDGVLLVSPSPRPLHQRAVGNLYALLRPECPDHLEVFVASLDVVLADDTVVIPDLLVARMADMGERNLPAVPVLAVEVLSPSTRSFDLHTKKDRYARAGCSHYWVVDPGLSDRPPSVTTWLLHEAEYVETGHAAGTDVLQVDVPFALKIVPGRLVER